MSADTIHRDSFGDLGQVEISFWLNAKLVGKPLSKFFTVGRRIAFPVAYVMAYTGSQEQNAFACL